MPVVSEKDYGIVWVQIDFVLSFLEKIQELKLKKELAVNTADSYTEENEQLRALLKECSRRIEDLIDWSDCKYDEAEELLTSINTALGESEEQ